MPSITIPVIVRDPRHLRGHRSFGLGYRTAVLQGDRIVGRALYEPFLRAVDGRLASIDGLADYQVPLMLTLPDSRSGWDGP